GQRTVLTPYPRSAGIACSPSAAEAAGRGGPRGPPPRPPPPPGLFPGPPAGREVSNSTSGPTRARPARPRAGPAATPRQRRLALPEHYGMHHQVVLVDQPLPGQRLDQRRAALDEDVAVVLGLEPGHLARQVVARDDRRVVP